MVNHSLFPEFLSSKFHLRILTIITLFCAALILHAETWVDDTFEDFVDGTLDASGNNIYVSRDGKIRTINRYDLNNDGWIDLYYSQTHNQVNYIHATLGKISSNREVEEMALAVDGSFQAEAADVNKDGWLDLIFCPNRSGIQYPRRFVTIIYGGPDGWPAHRSNELLPVHGASAIALADLNHDSWVDIVTLNQKGWLHGQPTGNIIRVFWGSEKGYILTRYHDAGVENAIDLASGDFDSDGADDVAVLKSDKTIKIFWATTSDGDRVSNTLSSISLAGDDHRGITAADCNNDGTLDLIIGSDRAKLHIVHGKKGRSWRSPVTVEGYNASHIEVGDLDGDKYQDMVLSFFKLKRAGGGEQAGADKGSSKYIRILWGGNNGFAASHSTNIEAINQKASAIGDFDGDGIADIAVAFHQGDVTYLTKSYIFYGEGEREFKKGDQGITSEGAYDVLALPSEKGKSNRLVFCNSVGGAVGEKVPAFIYWGGSDGFSPERRLEIPMRSGYEGTAADFNADGYTDLAIMDEMHHGGAITEDPWAGVNIFWGNADGIEIESRTILSESFLGSSNTADLNKDGYLDLVLGQYFKGEFKTHVIIYYGAEDGFNLSRRVAIPCYGRSLSIQLADYDKDGWLDIAANSYQEVGVRIFFGSDKGYATSRSVNLDAPAVSDLETADLNADGWLDLVVCCYRDFVNTHNDLGVLLFWGSEDGFKEWNSQKLPGFSPLGPVVADWDNDGFLDLFNPHYHGDISREKQPCYLFWGSAEGFFRQNRTHLINNSAADGIAADFNKDGLLDLSVANHTVDGNHNTDSKIFINDGNRFAKPQVMKVPTQGPHWSYNTDMGHIYDRSWQLFYESSPFFFSPNAMKGQLNYEAEIPEGTELEFFVRAAVDEKTLEEIPWQPLESGKFTLKDSDRTLQYKAIFKSDNGDRYPILDKVTID